MGFDPADHWTGPKAPLNGVIVAEPRYWCAHCRKSYAGHPYFGPMGSQCVRCGRGQGDGRTCADCRRSDLGLSRMADGKFRCTPCVNRIRAELQTDEERANQ